MNIELEQGYQLVFSREEAMDVYASLMTTAEHLQKPAASRRVRELADRVQRELFEQTAQRISGTIGGTGRC